MKVIIKETKEVESLNISRDGISFVKDFIGNTGAFDDGQFVYDDELDGYWADQATFDWWKSACRVHQWIDDVCEEIKYNSDFEDGDKESLMNEINDAVGNTDLDWFGVDSFTSFVEEKAKDLGYIMTVYGDGAIGFDKDKGQMKEKMITRLKELFGEMDGEVRLHWEGDETEAESFKTLDDCLSDVADAAIEREMTADEIERIAYIETESEHQARIKEYEELQNGAE